MAYPAVFLSKTFGRCCDTSCCFLCLTHICSVGVLLTRCWLHRRSNVSSFGFIHRSLGRDSGFNSPLSGISPISFDVLLGLSRWFSNLRHSRCSLYLISLLRIPGSAFGPSCSLHPRLARALSLCSMAADKSASSWTLFRFSDSPSLALQGKLSSNCESTR